MQGRQQIVRERFKDYVLWEGKTEEWFVKIVKLMMHPAERAIPYVGSRVYLVNVITRQWLTSLLRPSEEHNVEQKASGSVIVCWINPNQLEEHPDFRRRNGHAKHGAMEKENYWAPSKILSSWSSCVLRNVWRFLNAWGIIFSLVFLNKCFPPFSWT